MTPIIEVENVGFAYQDQRVLEDINLRVHERDFVAMIGPNGGGKTTLLKLLLGLLKPDQGRIRIAGKSPHQAAPSIGYVPQNVHINRNFPITAEDLVLMGKLDPARQRKRPSATDRRDACDALERLAMGAYRQRRISELSGGQLQRVFIARALVTRPNLLLLDEPTASIDTRGQAEFYSLLQALNSTMTILVVSHDLLVISRFVKSVACVNRQLHYHDQAEITGEMLESMYPCTDEAVCPVELVAHGLPHRVLREHSEDAP